MQNIEQVPLEQYQLSKMSQNHLLPSDPAIAEPLSDREKVIGVTGCQKKQESLENIWQKQLKIFIRSQSRVTSSKAQQSLKNKLKMTIDLIRGPQQLDKTQYNQKSQNVQLSRNGPPYRFGRLLRTNQPKICIVCLQRYAFGKITPSLQVSVINLQARIEYSVARIKKAEDLEVVLNEIKRICHSLLVIVENRQQFQQYFGKNKSKLQKIIECSETVELMSPTLSFWGECKYWINKGPKKYNTQVYYKHSQLFENALEKYANIRKMLVKNLNDLGSTPVVDLWPQIFPLSYNLSSSIIHIDKGSYKEQIQLYLPLLQELLKKSSKRLGENGCKVYQKRHFPVIVANAHVCWKCKARTFISCERCSRNEARTVALCLQCSSSYHQKMIVGRENICQNTVVRRWEQMDEQMNRLIQNQLIPETIRVKKQYHGLR